MMREHKQMLQVYSPHPNPLPQGEGAHTPRLQDNNPRLLNSDGVPPYAAPSTGAFIEISPEGHRMDAVRRRRGWEAPS
ncbi:hypothetical protein, partial [Methylomonas rosea]